MMIYTLDQLIEEANKLPPFPQTAQKALALIREEDTDASSLAQVIGTDQVLAAQLLRWANSAYYGTENRIVTVRQAIVLLGMDVIQELIMIHSVAGQLNKPLPGYDLRQGELWQHALGTALGAKIISKQKHLNIDEEAYFAGLLCDIGKLVFEKFLQKISFDPSEWGRHSFLEHERVNFGLDHAALGAEIARKWQLPENLVEAIACHHEPQAASYFSTLAATIHVADISMMALGVGIGIDGLRYPLEEKALKQLDMTEEDLFYLVDQISEQLSNAKEFIHFG